MDSYQVKVASCLLPALIIYAIAEIHRGWRVIRYKELSLSPNQRMYVGIVRLIKGDEAADRAYTYSMNKPDDMAFGAWTSFIGGIFTLIVCVIRAITIVR